MSANPQFNIPHSKFKSQKSGFWFLIFYFSVLNFIITACNLPSKGPNGELFTTAVQYNNYIIEHQKIIGACINSFYDQLNVDIDSANHIIAQGRLQAGKSIADIRGMPAFQGDSAFRDAAVHSFTFYKSLFENEYPRLISIQKENVTLSDSAKQAVQNILQQIVVKEEGYDKRLDSTQKSFAEKNNIKLAKLERK